jgi:Cu2+-exporting ATPase
MRFTDTTGATWSLGRPGFAAAESAESSEFDTHFRRDGHLVAGFCFRDTLRPESRQAIDWLRSKGLAIEILSGDRPEKVQTVAEQLGLPDADVHGGMSPEAKAEHVRAADAGKRQTLFLGDGANDSLAVKEAACSGTPLMDRSLLEEKSDFYFTGRGLGFLPVLFRVGAVRRSAVRRIFTFAAIYNFFAVLVCLGGWMHPVIAAIAMPAGSILTLALTVSCFRPWLAPGRRPETGAVRDARLATSTGGTA